MFILLLQYTTTYVHYTTAIQLTNTSKQNSNSNSKLLIKIDSDNCNNITAIENKTKIRYSIWIHL